MNSLTLHHLQLHERSHTRANRLVFSIQNINLGIINSFSAELFKVDSSMFKIGRLHFLCNNSLCYFDN